MAREGGAIVQGVHPKLKERPQGQDAADKKAADTEVGAETER